MTSSMAFRCVQAWLLEKPAAWVGKDAPSLAAALMVQRPPGDALRKRPREDALLEAARLRALRPRDGVPRGAPASGARSDTAAAAQPLLGVDICRKRKKKRSRLFDLR